MLAVLAVAALAAPPAPPVMTPAEVKETVQFVERLYDPATGGYRVTADGPPSVRACNGAVKALKALGAKPADAARTRAFVMGCYSPKAGAFAEPGRPSDVATTAVGVMVALELGVSRAELKAAVVTLGKTAKTFEEVRIAAAAVEAWGPKECPFDLSAWDRVVAAQPKPSSGPQLVGNAAARQIGSTAAYHLRLARPAADTAKAAALKYLPFGQKPDGGYGLGGTGGSDLESTYRVMRALHLAAAGPAEPDRLAAFLRSCRTAGGGYAVKPGDAATMSGTYYAAVIAGWLK